MSLNLNPHPAIDSSGIELPRVEDPHPWRRFWARRFDYLLFGLIVGLLMGLAGYELPTEQRSVDILFDMMLVVTWIPVEAIFLTLWGGTLGKLLFGIEVVTAAGARLSVLQALKRSAWVAVAGVGLGIPLLGLFGMWRGWQSVAESGSTYWDAPDGLRVIHHGFQWWRLLAVVGGLLVLATLLYLNGLLLPDFLDRLRPNLPGSADEG